MCFKFIKSGHKGCSKGDSCKYTHPKVCHSSLLSHKCDRIKCYFYHVTGTVRSNLNQNLLRTNVPKRPASHPTPLMNIKLPPSHPEATDPIAFPYRHIRHHLLCHIMLQLQVKLLISHLLFRSNEGTEVPNDTDATNSKLSAKEHYEPSMAPLTSPESSPIPAQMF